MHTIKKLAGLAASLALTAALVPSAASAVPTGGQGSAGVATPASADGDTVTIDTYLLDNKTLVSSQTYGAETKGLPMTIPSANSGEVSPMASGDGGSSSASGCVRVTVNNEGVSPNFGWHIYWYRTWTRWCWNRSTQTVYDVTNGYSFDDVASFTFWKGETNNEFGFYDYSTNNGYPRSAYKHYRQGSFDNCPIKFGCVETLYPSNTLRSYYNGTWAWSTSG